MFRTMKFGFALLTAVEEAEPEIEKLAQESASPEGLTAREAWPAVKQAGDALMQTSAGDVVIYHHRATPQGDA